MTSEGAALYSIAVNVKGFTEFIFVPVPGSCTEYYGITTYSNGVVFGSATPYVSDVIWCKIDRSGNNGLGVATVLPQTGLRIAKESINCTTRSPEGPNTNDFQMHIEVTTTRGNGERYLFASNSTCVAVLNMDGNGITPIDGYQTGGAFIQNLRSEMEVLRTNDLYEVAMPYYNDNSGNIYNSITFFNFDMSSGTPSVSHYQVSLPGEPSKVTYIKGIEYSENGLYVYASVLTMKSNLSEVATADNIVYFSRSSLGAPFIYVGVLTSGASTSDFGYGMLEKGVDGKLWCMGDSRMATLADNNNPGSSFNANAITVSNNLTIADHYNVNGFGNTNGPKEDVIKRSMYLMIDQIDGEDYSLWSSGGNLFPSTISVCSFPYNLTIPANSTVNYFPNPQPMYGGGSASVTHTGNMKIIYEDGSGCEFVELIEFIDDGIICDAEFAMDYDPELPEGYVYVEALTACDAPSNFIHFWFLYIDVGGVWQQVDAQGGVTSTNLGLIKKGNNRYWIRHLVMNNNSSCTPVPVSYVDAYFTY
jgi:hypothetical protein